jgi:hypothetical protein
MLIGTTRQNEQIHNSFVAAQTVRDCCLQIILVTAACTGFVQHVVEVRFTCKVSQNDRTFKRVH